VAPLTVEIIYFINSKGELSFGIIDLLLEIYII